MKKNLLKVLLVLVVLLVPFLANATEFSLSVTIPKASAANFVVFRVTDGAPFPTNPITGTALSFATTYVPQFNIFRGDYYYAINVQPTGGAGNVNVNINYADVTKPAGQTIGLGGKGLCTVSAVLPNNQEVQIIKKSLTNINNSQVWNLGTGYLRVYIGLASGDEPAALEVTPFSTGDKAGDYVGTLTLTAIPQ